MPLDLAQIFSMSLHEDLLQPMDGWDLSRRWRIQTKAKKDVMNVDLSWEGHCPVYVHVEPNKNKASLLPPTASNATTSAPPLRSDALIAIQKAMTSSPPPPHPPPHPPVVYFHQPLPSMPAHPVPI